MNPESLPLNLQSEAVDFGETSKAFYVASLGGYLKAWGATVPTDGTAGYAVGCTFHHTDGGDGTALYVNEGTASSCNFNAVTVGS